MVSRQEGTFYSRKRDHITIDGDDEFHNSIKRSKQEEEDQSQVEKLQSTLFNQRPTNSQTMRSNSITFDFQLHLHTPLPPKPQEEPKGYSRTSEDHRTYPNDPVIVDRPKMSLDLELNLSPSYSPSNTTTERHESANHNETVSSKGNDLMNPNNKSTSGGTGINRSLSWLAFEGDDDNDDVDHKEQDMVTKVCMKCHMLVMLSTSTPVCPNCKFMHPHDDSSTKLFKPSNLLRLLC